MRRTLSIVGGLLLGVITAQFPEYAQQYEQRLGGAVDELRVIVEDFDHDADAFGLTRDQALARYAASRDAFLVARGRSMARTLQRYQTLSSDLALLQASGAMGRVQHLNVYFDSDISRRALETFVPAVPATPEGFGWGFVGFALGYLALWPFFGFLTLPFRWRRGQLPASKVLNRRQRI